VAGGEPAAQAVGGGANAGQDDVAGRAPTPFRFAHGDPVLAKNGKAFAAWTMVDRPVGSFPASERHGCRVLCVPRAAYRYRSCLDPRTELWMRIREIAQARVRYGYRKIRVLLKREGWDVGKYLVYRLYTEEGLCLKRMKPAGKRKATRQREERFKATRPDEAWSMDFVTDPLQDGTRFRSLTIVDVHTREAVAIEVGQSLNGDDVVRTLNRLNLDRGVPKVLFCDNGSEFISQVMDLWAYRNNVKIDFLRPGRPRLWRGILTETAHVLRQTRLRSVSVPAACNEQKISP